MRSSVTVVNVANNNGPFVRITAPIVSCAGRYLGSYRRNDVENIGAAEMSQEAADNSNIYSNHNPIKGVQLLEAVVDGPSIENGTKMRV
ncbi:hypothetical protein V501_06950 [Pseudogymnoascus sp. VKM F-4519 (FW-2642)]|nr:hypothetical protein V501_06950 [Pseudogymnoascus sp. VKM F-4519 (FW-2642)]